MKIDGPLYSRLEDTASEARRMADLGYDGLYTLATGFLCLDPRLPPADGRHWQRGVAARTEQDVKVWGLG